MDMFIANATKQLFSIQYRLPEKPRVMIHDIPIGTQIKIPGDLSTPEVEAIVTQLTTYGMISVDDVSRAKAECPLVYSIGRPVTAAKMGELARRNIAAKDDLGQVIRQQAAVALSDQAEKDLKSAMPRSTLKAVDISVVEVEPAGGYRTANPFGEGFRIDRMAPTGPASPRGARAARGGRR